MGNLSGRKPRNLNLRRNLRSHRSNRTSSSGRNSSLNKELILLNSTRRPFNITSSIIPTIINPSRPLIMVNRQSTQPPELLQRLQQQERKPQKPLPQRRKQVLQRAHPLRILQLQKR